MEGAAQDEAGRKAAVEARLAVLAADQAPATTPTTPSAQSSSYARSRGKSALRLKASDALRLVSEQQRRRGEAMRTQSVIPEANVSMVNTGKSRADIDRQNAEAELQSVLGTTGNGAMNMQLLGALANIGGQAAFAYGARAPAGGGGVRPGASSFDYVGTRPGAGLA